MDSPANSAESVAGAPQLEARFRTAKRLVWFTVTVMVLLVAGCVYLSSLLPYEVSGPGGLSLPPGP